jgi:hypothetical protein
VPGITINGTNASTYGKLIVNAGVSLTIKGYDLSTNAAMVINQYANFSPASGSTVIVDNASDYSSAIVNNGNIVSDGATFTIPLANIKWDNSSGNQTISGASKLWWDPDQYIFAIKLLKGSDVDAGIISILTFKITILMNIAG